MNYFGHIAKNLAENKVRRLLDIKVLRRIAERTLIAIGRLCPNSETFDRIVSKYADSLSPQHIQDEPRIASFKDGWSILLTISDYFHRHLYFCGTFEPQTTAITRNLLRNGGVFIDVGANIGYYSCLAAHIGAMVHAFEPNPRMADFIRRSAEMNCLEEYMRVNVIAVSEDEHKRVLYLSTDRNNTGLSSTLPLSYLSKNNAIEVPSTSLDQYCARHDLGHIRLIKVDVEGAESSVIAGAGRLLGEHRVDAWICEMNTQAGIDGAIQVYDTLVRAGYRPYLITSRGLKHLPSHALHVLERSLLPPNCCFISTHVKESDLVNSM